NNFLKGEFSDAFYVLIQVGPIAACALVFWRDIASFFTDWKNPATKDYVLKLFAAFFLTGLGGFIAKISGLKLPETILPVALAVLIGGFIIFAVEYKSKKRELNVNLTWAVVAAVAAGQLIAAIFPGASRSGMAIMAALIVGLSRPQAVKFSFLVGIPTMFAAGSYELFKEIKAGNTAGLFTPEAIVAYIAATIFAWLTVVWLLKFVQTRNFIPFAWYRTGLGIILLALLGFGAVS
ncbi:MAG: undecaprenyl-diphosphate phosphatase, partial [Fibromonadales bacterium]|nr:undecaprenyl-diphosphate phosphatase [Fibromonadales bacterium]